MAFVSRTTRESDVAGQRRLQTSPAVGPGSYQGGASFGSQRPNFAPFGSTTRRRAPSNKLVTPGPGNYDYALAATARQQGSSTAFASRTLRFTEKPPDLPGPGAYTAHREWQLKHSPGRRRARPETTQPAVSWVRVPTAPSIPAPSQSFGYEEGAHGELIMQPNPYAGYTGKGADTVGPGHYRPEQALRAQAGARAANFSLSRTHRVDFSKATGGGATPGPGAYEPAPASDSDSGSPTPQSSPKRPTATFVSRVVRDSPARKEAAKAPGPGAYEAPSAFRPRKLPEHMQFFGSTSRRFTHLFGPAAAAAAPGPGAYAPSESGLALGAPVAASRASLRSTASKSQRRVRGPPQQGPGFTSTAPRFSDAQRKEEAPGVGAYRTEGMADEVEKRRTSRYGVFGSTGKRFAESSSSELPGPGAYEPPPAPSPNSASAAALAKPSAAFVSSSKRYDPASKTSSVPPPGSYDVKPSWSRGRGLMASGGSRFHERALPAEVPGPGSYEDGVAGTRNMASTKLRKRVVVAKSPRFQQQVRSESPGPGFYDTDYFYGGLTKPTFNMTIAEDTVAGF